MKLVKIERHGDAAVYIYDNGKRKWRYGVKHPGAGLGWRKGKKRSAAERRKQSASLKKHWAANPDIVKARGEKHKLWMAQNREKNKAQLAKATAASAKATKERSAKKQALWKLAEVKYEHRSKKPTEGENGYSYLIRAACDKLEDVFVLPDQNNEYYEEILDYFKPDVLKAIQTHFNKK